MKNENKTLLIEGDVIQNYGEFNNFFVEGKKEIKKFMNKKLQRFLEYTKTKKEISIKRLEEDHIKRKQREEEDFELMEKRGKDIKMEEDRKIERFKEEIELKLLEKKLKIKQKDPEDFINLENMIPLDEDLTNKNRLDKNKQKKGEKNIFN